MAGLLAAACAPEQHALVAPKPANAATRAFPSITSMPLSPLPTFRPDGRDKKEVALGPSLFALDSAVLTPRVVQALTALLPEIRRSTGTVGVTGYADGLGDAAHNLVLSRQRAEAVGNWLSHHEINPDRIRTMGLGSQGAEPGVPEPALRRVVITIQEHV